MANRREIKRVLIMAGGTGGHVFPGLAVANYLREKGIEVHWLGTKKGLEARVVPAANIPLHFITITGLRGKGVMSMMTAPINIIKAVMQAKKIIQKINPDVVIGMGGFASGPGGIASWFLHRPLVVHEQNAKAGLTNRMLSYVAARVLEGFPGAFKSKANVVTVGNPVRSEIEDLPSPRERFAAGHPFRLLVLGGSLGAQRLNEIVPNMLALLSPEKRPQVLHQTGDKHIEATKNLYQSMGIQATLVPFIEDMAEAYRQADMVICRAGALTVAELCAAGVGAILVPFPHAVDDHQTANAQLMVKGGAAICIQQKELTESRLADIVGQVSASPERCLAMANAAFALRRVNVQEKIFNILCEI
ncbi:MAG: hypothetical protein ACD_45C00747G0002 [uncultured bacterium]|nr:MAG: hypothetical protein ACD_45C00747G0002 [uncultured bacterium]